jgi:ferrous iron transport protein B
LRWSATKNTIRVALLGAPNVGKSTLFNTLVGAHRFVGNWPGKTVDRYEGELEHHGIKLRLVDLPGTYSLSAQTEEEEIARDYILHEKPDVVLVIVSALSLETTLYLALQALELTSRVVIVVNKIDAAERMGIHIHFDKLSSLLGVPVIPISALHRTGLHEAIEAVINVALGNVHVRGLNISYGIVDYYIAQVEKSLHPCLASGDYPLHWLALKLIEGDKHVEAVMREKCPKLYEDALRIREKISGELGKSPELLIASSRYEFISKLVEEATHRGRLAAPPLTEKLDRILLRPVIGHLALLLILVLLIGIMLTINTGFPVKQLAEILGIESLAELFENYTLSGLIAFAFNWLGRQLREAMLSLNFPGWLASLLVDGALAGVSGVLSFLPLIFLVFVAFGFLEDTGAMSRLATVYHNLMVRIGLSGKALMPILLGFGCNVPAVMGTKILNTDREKLLASFLAPLIPCQARLVVLLMLVSLLPNPALAALLLLFIYSYSFLLIGVVGYLINKAFLRAEEEPSLILELPPYHLPSLRVIWWYAWDNTVHFLKKAGLIIFTLSSVMSILLTFGPGGLVNDVKESFAYLISSGFAPILTPIGLGRWEVALALLTGFIAKESIASTLLVITGRETPQAALAALNFTTPQIVALMLFVTLYTPCAATVGAFHSQVRNARYTLFLVLSELSVALASAYIAYQLLSLVMH